MALAKQLKQIQFMLYGWLRFARRRYVALSIFGLAALMLGPLMVRDLSIPQSSLIQLFCSRSCFYGQDSSPHLCSSSHSLASLELQA